MPLALIVVLPSCASISAMSRARVVTRVVTVTENRDGAS
jgi:hypothetical protein